MKKFTVELILPDDYELTDVSDIITFGCNAAMFPKGINNSLFKLCPQIVTCSPFNENHVTMVLNEEQLSEDSIERLRNK